MSVSSRVSPAGRLLVEIDELFAGSVDLPFFSQGANKRHRVKGTLRKESRDSATVVQR